MVNVIEKLIGKMFQTVIIPDWKEIDNSSDLDQLIQESYKKPVIIFKHSTACGISQSVKLQLEEDHGEYLDGFQIYFLDLLENREMSDKIADRFNVIHQSPQVILLINGKVVYHASHHAIKAEVLAEEAGKLV